MHKIGYFPEKNTHNNVYSFIYEYAKENPSKSIFKWINGTKVESISFEDFCIEVTHIAAGMKERGVDFGDRCIVFLPVTVTMYKILAALQYIGATPVFFDSWTRKLHLQTAIEQINPKGIVSFDKAFAFFANIPFVNEIPIKIIDTQLPQSTNVIDLVPVTQEHSALITFTTGSSGTPKAANRTHNFLSAQHYALGRYIKYTSDDIDLTSFPIFSLNAIASGASSMIPAIDIGNPKEDDGEVLVNQIKNSNVSCLTLSPSLFNAISLHCHKNNVQLAFLRTVITGGAPISFDELKNFEEIAQNADIQVLYGSTEVEPMAHMSLRELTEEELKVKAKSTNGIYVGKVDDELKYKVIKIEENYEKIASTEWIKYEQKVNEVGELIVTGEHVCNNYYNNPEAFKRSKIVDDTGTIWHRTGDVVRIDENQEVWLLGRVHNVVKRQNIYLFPVPVESQLKRLSFVRHAAYIGMPDTVLGQAAYVVIEPQEYNEAKLNQWYEELTAMLEENKIAYDKLLFQKEIPMDPRHHSKVEYTNLRNQLLSL